MSYGQFLIVFLVVPILGLAFLLRRHLTRRYLRSVAVLAIVAFVYTTPWDNLIVALGVWTYDPALIAGIILGYVPLEEYLFYVLQTILSSLVLLALLRRTSPKSQVPGPEESDARAPVQQDSPMPSGTERSSDG